MKCDRCGKETNWFTVSMFNTDNICMECKAKEKKHPNYRKAVEADMAEIRKGNYNFIEG
jgi:hypothetical protein